MDIDLSHSLLVHVLCPTRLYSTSRRYVDLSYKHLATLSLALAHYLPSSVDHLWRASAKERMAVISTLTQARLGIIKLGPDWSPSSYLR